MKRAGTRLDIRSTTMAKVQDLFKYLNEDDERHVLKWLYLRDVARHFNDDPDLILDYVRKDVADVIEQKRESAESWRILREAVPEEI